MAVRDLLHYLFLTVIGLIVAGICLKFWNRQSTEKEIVAELRSLASPTSSFEQFYAEEAGKTLFKSIAQLRIAEKKLGRDPREILDKVFHGRGEGALFPSDDPTDKRYVDPREDLIRSGLLRNYQNCKSLGIFEEEDNQRKMAEGEPPVIPAGQSAGLTAELTPIISPEVAPGIEKIIPNLKITPPVKEKAKPTEFEIKQAKALAETLSRAQLIEGEARDRITEHYDRLAHPEAEAEAEAEEANTEES